MHDHAALDHHRRARRPTARDRPLVATLTLSVAFLVTATAPASADAPWSPPSVLAGMGNGPAATTALGHVVALTTAPRGQVPNAASELVR